MFVLAAVFCAYHIKDRKIYDTNDTEVIPIVADVALQRISQNLWEQALDGAAGLGATAVSVPIFWSVFDEDAETQTTQLSNFLTMAIQKNLDIVVKLGPYVSEFYQVDGSGLSPLALQSVPKAELRTASQAFVDTVGNSFFDPISSALSPFMEHILYVELDSGKPEQSESDRKAYFNALYARLSSAMQTDANATLFAARDLYVDVNTVYIATNISSVSQL